jgi:uncharacterized protein YllA (UPF0747 family)
MPSSLFSSYLASGMRESAFFPSGFGDRAARVARVKAAARPLAAGVVEALRAQNAALPPSPAREANLAALGEGAATIVTGQQVGLFLGPLYSLHKAATAVVAARVLQAESGVRCVPIFWLQTEDHDFAEIASATLLPARTLQLAANEARVSVAHRRLGPEVETLVAALGDAIADQPHAAEVHALFGAAYCPGASLAAAFARAMAHFFEELVFVDPRDARLLDGAAPVFHRAVADAAEIERVLVERGEALRQAGFDEQVRPRPGQTLIFHHPEGAEGPRFRLPVGRPLDGDPLAFSTSALLRPILQDFLLPTAAQVGGPGELAYLGQVTALHPLFGLEPPMYVPRARFRLIPPPVRRLLDQLQIAPADAEDPALLTRLSPPAEAGPARAWLAELEARLDGWTPPDEKLRQDAARARATVRYAIDRLERRHRRANAARDTTLAERVLRLQGWLLPDGEPQERVLSAAWFAAYAGCDRLRRAWLDNVDLFDPSVKDLFL